MRNHIKRLVLSGGTEQIRKQLLSKDQIRLVLDIAKRKNKSITSTELAIEEDLSLPSASLKLIRLHNAGYLTRTSVKNKSGGGYVYRFK